MYTFAQKEAEKVFKNGYNGYKNIDMLYLSNGYVLTQKWVRNVFQKRRHGYKNAYISVRVPGRPIVTIIHR